MNVGNEAEELGDLELSSGNLSAARDNFQQSAEVFERVLDPDQYMRERMVIVYKKLGELDLRFDNVSAARDAFQNALKHGAGPDLRFEPIIADYSNEYEKIGDICMEAGVAQTARDEYQKGLEIAQARAQRDPANAQSQHALAIACEKLGDVKRRLHRPDAESRHDYQQTLEIATKLTQRNSSNRQVQRDVAVSHLRLADLNQESGSASAARDEYRQAVIDFLQLAKDDPKNSAAQAELAYCYGECGYLQQAGEEFPSAIRCLEKGIAILEKMRDAELLGDEPKYQIWLVGQQTNLEQCKRSQLAIDNLESASQQWPGEVPEFLALCGRVFARHGRLADAAAAADKRAALEPRTAGNVFHAAEVYALCVTNMANPPAAPSPKAIAQRKLYWSRARELLQQAFDLWATPKSGGQARA